MAEYRGAWSGGDQTANGSHAPGEWPALYAQYLLRAASQSTRTSELYQRVLDCVARGELPPTVFRDALPAFMQARGTVYTSRMAEVSARFFSGMVLLNAAASQELLSLLLPGEPARTSGAPPEFDAADPIRWYQRLTEHAGQLTSQTMTTFQAVLEQVARGEIAPHQVQEASAGYVAERLPEHLNRLGSLYFDLLNGLNDLRADYEEALLTGALAGAKVPGQEAPAALNLAAPLGGSTTTSLVLTNTRAEPAVIRAAVGEVRRADGVGPAFDPKIVVTPAELQVPPGGQATLVLSLHLDQHAYAPDALYVGAVHIERAGEPRLEIPLRIIATPIAAPAPPRKTTQRKAAKTTRRKRAAAASQA